MSTYITTMEEKRPRGRPTFGAEAASKRLQVRMTPDELAAAQQWAEQKGATLADLVRSWLAKQVARTQK